MFNNDFNSRCSLEKLIETKKQNIEILQHKVINKFLFTTSLRKRKKMAKTIKFVNLLILFIFTFLVVTDASSNPYPYLFLTFLFILNTKYFIPYINSCFLYFILQQP